tara:strand:+ start:35076 stop:35711 length:636 start_codon:yes stop_codon:yes gene_type:complete
MTQAPQGNYNPPAHNWAAGHQPKSDATSWVLPMIIGAVIFAVGCGSGLIVGWFGGTTNNLMDFVGNIQPAEITITPTAPTMAVVGEPITVTISITDLSGSPRTIQDIDWSGSMVDNMQFGTMTPNPRSNSIDQEYRELVFNQSLGADQSADFTFELTPLHPGVYTAEITVYMDDYNSEWTELLIEVHEKPEDSDNPADPDPSIDSPAKSEP